MMVKWILLLVMVDMTTANAQSSQCYGSISNGRLSSAVKLPASGENFDVYSHWGHRLGRTYLHSTVKTIVLNAYAELSSSHPNYRYKYAETGFSGGGQFSPHKTHQNGLSVDFMVPVMNEEGQSIELPTHMSNKWGYNIEFDDKGHHSDFHIDYHAMLAHLLALDKAAKAEGYAIKKVIFDPALQQHLFKYDANDLLKSRMKFSQHRVWVRHDEHYHVDFDVPCLPINEWPPE